MQEEEREIDPVGTTGGFGEGRESRGRQGVRKVLKE